MEPVPRAYTYIRTINVRFYVFSTYIRTYMHSYVVAYVGCMAAAAGLGSCASHVAPWLGPRGRATSRGPASSPAAARASDLAASASHDQLHEMALRLKNSGGSGPARRRRCSLSHPRRYGPGRGKTRMALSEQSDTALGEGG